MQISPKNVRLPKSILSSAAWHLRNALYDIWPNDCRICGRRLMQGEKHLCLDCLASLPFIRSSETVAYFGIPDNRIEVRPWFYYHRTHPSRQLILDLKYRDCPGLGRYLGREYATHLVNEGLDIDLLLPIPLHRSKLLVRGYNQSYEIARGIRDVTGVTIGKNLHAIRPHATQTERIRRERIENVMDIFGVKHPEELTDKKIALLDDVITTGSTMYSALESILAEASPASVTFLALCHSSIR